MIEQSDEAEYQRQEVKLGMSCALHGARQVFLASKSRIIDESDAADPVSVLKFALSFCIILTADEIPHEIAPEHPTTLIIKEESDILTECRNHHTFSRAVATSLRCDTHVRFVDITLVDVSESLFRAVPHTRENRLDVVIIDIFSGVFRYFDIFTLIVVLIINRCTLSHIVWFCHIIRSVKQRPTAILLTFQI